MSNSPSQDVHETHGHKATPSHGQGEKREGISSVSSWVAVILS